MNLLIGIIIFSMVVPSTCLISKDKINKYKCSSTNGNLCCKTKCGGLCGNCTQGLNATFDSNCCSTSITRICSQEKKIRSPCLFVRKEKSNEDNESEVKSGFEEIGDWLKDQSIVLLVFISIGLLILIIIALYACFIFGKKYPPVEYERIVLK